MRATREHQPTNPREGTDEPRHFQDRAVVIAELPASTSRQDPGKERASRQHQSPSDEIYGPVAEETDRAI